MVFVQKKDSAFVELTRFGAQQIIMNMEMGVKAFKGVESSLIEHNAECLNGSVNVKQCFEYCDSGSGCESDVRKSISFKKKRTTLDIHGITSHCPEASNTC